MAIQKDKFMEHLEKITVDELKDKTYIIYSQLDFYQKYSKTIDLNDISISRRFQYLNKNYSTETRILNSLIKSYKENNDKVLLLYLSKKYFLLEKEAFKKEDYPQDIENYPIEFK